MSPAAPRHLVILTEGEFGPHSSKTAWGVIRYGRDDVVAVLDSTLAGRNVAEWLPGHDIPIVGRLADALAVPGRARPDGLLIGIAPTGGRLPDAWRIVLLEAMVAGLEIHSGLHTLLGDDPDSRRRRPRLARGSSTIAGRRSAWTRPSGVAICRAGG